MRISDWSSGVCSSDLRAGRGGEAALPIGGGGDGCAREADRDLLARFGGAGEHDRLAALEHGVIADDAVERRRGEGRRCCEAGERERPRSEERRGGKACVRKGSYGEAP